MKPFVRHDSMKAVAGAGALVVGLAACASRVYVEQRIESARGSDAARTGAVATQVEATRLDVGSLGRTSLAPCELVAVEADAARRALERAIEAEALATIGHAPDSVVSDAHVGEAGVPFSIGSAELSDPARDVLDRFAAGLQRRSESVYVEVRGRADDLGSAGLNLRLGERRAEAVMHYLHLQMSIPLGRMTVISYGENRPLADNRTSEGRARNRCVTLAVLS
jgi:outer membrane protein OmpA-like peptidoglycan-associated protein